MAVIFAKIANFKRDNAMKTGGTFLCTKKMNIRNKSLYFKLIFILEFYHDNNRSILADSWLEIQNICPNKILYIFFQTCIVMPGASFAVVHCNPDLSSLIVCENKFMMANFFVGGRF